MALVSKIAWEAASVVSVYMLARSEMGQPPKVTSVADSNVTCAEEHSAHSINTTDHHSGQVGSATDNHNMWGETQELIHGGIYRSCTEVLEVMI